MSNESKLLVSFPDQSHSFVHGFEAGQLWQRLSDGEAPIEKHTIHRKNCEVVDRMALHFGCTADWQHYDHVYSTVTIRSDGSPITDVPKFERLNDEHWNDERERLEKRAQAAVLALQRHTQAGGFSLDLDGGFLLRVQPAALKVFAETVGHNEGVHPQVLRNLADLYGDVIGTLMAAHLRRAAARLELLDFIASTLKDQSHE